MKRPPILVLDGRAYPWKDILAARQAQLCGLPPGGRPADILGSGTTPARKTSAPLPAAVAVWGVARRANPDTPVPKPATLSRLSSHAIMRASNHVGMTKGIGTADGSSPPSDARPRGYSLAIFAKSLLTYGRKECGLRMIVAPLLDVKKNNSELEPSELIRLREHGRSHFGLIGSFVGHDKTALASMVMLDFMGNGAQEPFFMIPKFGMRTHLSYGTAYFNEIDQSEDFVDLDGSGFAEKAGL